MGNIDLGGTIGLYLFGGIFPGLLSGIVYVVLRRWLPSGRLGGVAFGVLHLVIAATRVDPLRPENRDFDLVGPGWLSVATFAIAAILHGMAVVAIANRYSTRLPLRTSGRAERVRAFLPLAAPALLLVPAVVLLIPITVGLAVTAIASHIRPVAQAAQSRAVLVGGRIALAVLAVALLPGTVTDLRDVIDRDAAAVSVSLRR